ncbi:hypothetical protein Taro_027476 [Colocasia esculenta]|uniref:Uncharacterized protein n=1 Tax=Colocasia esculenta TaxID=4460 RepID=A0A843V8T5_COLES|nr:hypothetical protein [Colocasia esculenta]
MLVLACGLGKLEELFFCCLLVSAEKHRGGGAADANGPGGLPQSLPLLLVPSAWPGLQVGLGRLRP